MTRAKQKSGVPDALSGTPLRSVCGILCGQQKSAKPYSLKKLPKSKENTRNPKISGVVLELLTRFELVTSSLPTAVEPSSPCCIRLCGVFLSKKDEVAACLFHCFRPLISPCGSRCGSELLQDMNKGPAFGNGNPPILLIANKRLKLHGTYSVSSIPQAWQKMK